MDSLDLVKLTEVFLLPSAILVGALGVAATEQLKTGVSLLGLILSGLWLAAISDSTVFPPATWKLGMLFLLAVVFGLGWLVTFVIHAFLWGRATEDSARAKRPES